MFTLSEARVFPIPTAHRNISRLELAICWRHFSCEILATPHLFAAPRATAPRDRLWSARSFPCTSTSPFISKTPAKAANAWSSRFIPSTRWFSGFANRTSSQTATTYSCAFSFSALGTDKAIRFLLTYHSSRVTVPEYRSPCCIAATS